MVDQHIHLTIEEKDEDLKGCRLLHTRKNRFGGAGHIAILSLHKTGFNEVGTIEG